MRLEILVKQDTYKTIKMNDIKTYYFDKNYLVVTHSSGNRNWFKANTVMSIEETK